MQLSKEHIFSKLQIVSKNLFIKFVHLIVAYKVVVLYLGKQVKSKTMECLELLLKSNGEQSNVNYDVMGLFD